MEIAYAIVRDTTTTIYQIVLNYDDNVMYMHRVDDIPENAETRTFRSEEDMAQYVLLNLLGN